MPDRLSARRPRFFSAVCGLCGLLVVALTLAGGAPPVQAAALPKFEVRAKPAEPILTPKYLDAANAEVLARFMKLIDRNHWRDAEKERAKLTDPIARKVAGWVLFTSRGAPVEFEEVATFLDSHPDWPLTNRIENAAEEALTGKTPADRVMAWFKDRKPQTANGRTRLIAALMQKGRKAEAVRLIRETWADTAFGRKQERSFYRAYRRHLSYDDHLKRIDQLIWSGQSSSARRMLFKLNKADRPVYQARIWLMRMEGNVDWAVSQVPNSLQDDPGLVYERTRWRRRKGMDTPAFEMLSKISPTAETQAAEAWWVERSILTRRFLQEGLVSRAYELASGHRLTPDQAADYSEAEWMAGWIALRFLREPEKALKHFINQYRSVEYPISLSRGAYWAGRAAEAGGDKATATGWYVKAAKHGTTYYGQLAAVKLNPGRKLILATDPQPTEALSRRFAEHELSKAARALFDADALDPLRWFVLTLAEVDPSPEWQQLSALLARKLDRPDMGILIAKRASRTGVELTEVNYPTLALPPLPSKAGVDPVEPALVHAVIRQESAFRTFAKSHADARGLMQLMPATASRVAHTVNVRYQRQKLTEDPTYNLMLGQTYLSQMVDQYKGSYVLALAAYNAGPARANYWVRLNGHPADPAVDAVDWVELIPFEETRNYVQRVLENLQVYRRRLAGTEVALTLQRDLQR